MTLRNTYQNLGIVGIIMLLVATPTMAQQWEDISAPLFTQTVSLDTSSDVFNRGMGSILYLPKRDELLAVTNGVNGLFTSQDQGGSWQEVAGAELLGRNYGGFGINYDYDLGRYAIFMIARSSEQSATSLIYAGADQGFIHFNEPADVQHDAWTWGMPDWNQDSIQVILGKQHHAWVKLWLSTDAGQSWELLDFESRNPGVINDSVFVAGNDDGMYRTTDQGKSWSKINQWQVTGKNPVRYNSDFYWTTTEGLIYSTDLGETWNLLGSELEGALWGPYFGQDQDHILLVNQDGFHTTIDGGKAWNKVAGYFTIPDSNRGGEYHVMHPTNSYAWDWKNQIIYAAGLGGRLYRLQVQAGQ